MNTHDIELPPLPLHPSVAHMGGRHMQADCQFPSLYVWAKNYARAAIEPYVETLFKIGEHLGIDYQEARTAPGKPSDVYIAAIEADRKRRGEPVGYIMPTALKQLKLGGNAIVGGVSQGCDVAVYLAPQPAEPVSTHHVHRGVESLPCYCKGKDDHPIGKETLEPVKVPSDDDIRRVARDMYLAGDLVWLGFDKDENGEYTQPKISSANITLIRALLARYGQPAEPVACFKCGHAKHGGECVNVAPQPSEPEHSGWYCAHCQRGVDSSEVTFHEQHLECGRVITDDSPPHPAENSVNLEVAIQAISALHSNDTDWDTSYWNQAVGRCVSELNKLRSQRPAEPVAWLPIETAPEDGCWALVCGDGAMDCMFIRKGHAPENWTNPNNPNLTPSAVTHWMPLPEFAPQPAEPATPRTQFEDARVQRVYEIICGDNHPPEGEHWDGYVSRLIVDALQSQDREDAQRFRWLTEDHADAETRTRCREILDRMAVMSYSSACDAIDHARRIEEN